MERKREGGRKGKGEKHHTDIFRLRWRSVIFTSLGAGLQGVKFSWENPHGARENPLQNGLPEYFCPWLSDQLKKKKKPAREETIASGRSEVSTSKGILKPSLSARRGARRRCKTSVLNTRQRQGWVIRKGGQERRVSLLSPQTIRSRPSFSLAESGDWGWQRRGPLFISQEGRAEMRRTAGKNICPLPVQKGKEHVPSTFLPLSGGQWMGNVRGVQWVCPRRPLQTRTRGRTGKVELPNHPRRLSQSWIPRI